MPQPHAPIRQRPDTVRPVLAGTVAVALGGFVTTALVDLGPLSLQMLQHLAVMNIAVPLVALYIGRHVAANALLPAGIVQLLALWAWHVPAVQQSAASSPIWQFGLLISLAGAAFWFWSAVIFAPDWKGLIAVLLTGKLVCLLGALLIFAPRDLYRLDGLVLAFCSTGPSSLADQQLAGLLMITACPLSYLVTGVALAARMLQRVEGGGHSSHVAARAR